MDEQDYQLLELLQQGLPVCPEPYAQLAETLALSEQALIERIQYLKKIGVIKRFGVIVNHRLLGYRANAMIVWNVPDAQVETVGQALSQIHYVSLCYQRPRKPGIWPYNLYCMVYGKNRGTVLQQIDELIRRCQLEDFSYQVLFSTRCFKQRGALYPVLQTEKADG